MRLHLIANSKSGQGKGDDIATLAQRVCNENGVTLINYEIENPEDLDAKAKQAVEAARKNKTEDVVVAAGGDGTLRSVAENLIGSGVTYAVIPCGTFNFFARAHGIPDDHEAAMRIAIKGRKLPIRLGEINGRIFLINASIGLYAKSISEREQSTKRFGRHQIVVLLSTLKTLLKPHRLLHTSFKSKNGERPVETPMIFIGNNTLQLRNLKLSVAECMKNHQLAVVTLKPVRGLEMLRVLFRGLARTLENDERLETFCANELKIGTKRRQESVALDGEMFELTSPFEIRALPDAIKMMKP